ncbi:hypothetical protein MBLNU457_4118t2 [Dothideomycetes sp. NU457]
MSDYNSTARFLANPNQPSTAPARSPNRTSTPNSPAWTRRSHSPSTYSQRPATFKQKLLSQTQSTYSQWLQTARRMTLLQQVLFVVGGVSVLVLGILFLVYNERIFAALEPVAKRWRELRGGWLILWFVTFVVSFPPLIGYSSCVTLAGFVFGVGPGWLIVASATILGSTASFIASRYFLQRFVQRMTEQNKKFNALALTLKHDGFKLLIMIRLCPLPYSFSNGAISTIPTVKPLPFMLATACASPKLFLHVFIGSRLSALAESGDKMDAKTKAVSYISIAIGVAAGITVGWFMYIKTAARARELEAQEQENAEGAGRASDIERGLGLEDDEYEYSDDPTERQAAEALARQNDGISLHTAAAEEEEERRAKYRDDFADEGEEDARSLDDVFRAGDGDDEDAYRDDEDNQWR